MTAQTPTAPSSAQVARQRRRERSGQYEANACYLCGRGAPIDDYSSHALTDADDQYGEHGADMALCLCDGCGRYTYSLQTVQQLQVYTLAAARYGIRRDRAELIALAWDPERPAVAELVAATVAVRVRCSQLNREARDAADAAGGLAPSSFQARGAALTIALRGLDRARALLIEQHVTTFKTRNG